MSLRYRFMAWGLSLLTVTLLITAVVGAIYARRQLYQATAALQDQVAGSAARSIEANILRKLERLQDAGQVMARSPLAGDVQVLLGHSFLKRDPAFNSLTIVDPSGAEVLKIPESDSWRVLAPAEWRASRAFSQASGGSSFISAVATAVTGESYLTLAVPLQSSAGQRGAVLVAEINLKFLREVLAGFKFGHGGYVYLVDENDNLIAHPNGILTQQPGKLDHAPLIGAAGLTLGANDQRAAQISALTGEKVLGRYAPMPRLDWAVIAEEPARLALAELSTLYRYGAMLLGIAVLGGAALIAWLSGSFTGPIQELRQAVAIVGHGNLEHRAVVRSNDEIGQLAGEFNKMADILKNSYESLEEKIKHRTAHIAALYQITAAVNQSLGLDRVLQQVVERITQIFGFDKTRVYLFDADRRNLALRAYSDPQPEPLSEMQRLDSGTSIVGHVARTGETVIFSDVEDDPRYQAFSANDASHDAGCHFLALLPIKVHGKPLGALALSGSQPRVLTEEELRLLSSMSAHIAVAVEKGNLFDQVVSRSRHLEVLNKIGAAVSRSLYLGEVLDQAVDKIAETAGFDAAWFYQLDECDASLRLKAFHGLSDDMAATMGSQSVDLDVGGQVIESGERLVFEDIQNDSLYRTLARKAKAVTLGFASAAAFPVKAKEKIIGTLHVASRSQRHFGADDLQLIESIAQQIGVATENALLFAEINDKTQELAKNNQELLDATRAKSEFVAAMSHELRTPLNIVIGSSDLLRDGLFGALTEGQARAIDKISRNARVLLKMINDLLTISRFDANRVALDLATVEIDEIMEQVRALVEQINRDHRLEVRWHIDENIPPLVTDSLKLEEILQNLIGNAFKFTPNGHVEVRVSNRPDDDRVVFSVADSGIGIAAEDRDRIFNAFEQLKDAHTGHFNGVGLGLNIVRRYLDIMQGDIAVDSEPGRGSTFTFTVPRSLQLNS